MAITLLDMAAAEQKPLKKAILMAFFKGSLPSPVDTLPVANAPALSQQIVRLTDPGTPSTRNIGDAVAAYQAQFTQGQETLKIIENKITIDKVLLDVKTYVQDPIAMQTKAYGLVIKNTVNDLFVTGDPGGDVTQPAGLDYRLRNDAHFVNQAVNANNLDVDANDTNRNAWLSHIDNAITLVRGIADAAIVNRQTWLAFRAALRVLKLLDTTKDQFDRVIMQYGSTRIYDAGQKPAGALSSAAANQVIGDDSQTSIFGTASTTPMYFVNTSEEDGVRLLQLHPLRVTRVGLDTSDPGQFVIDITWPIGFLVPQKFAISSVEGLNIS